MDFDFINFSKKDAMDVLNLPDYKLPDLIEKVYEIRKKFKGNIVNIHLLSNAKSGDCTQNCSYCAQSCDSKANIEKYSTATYDRLLRVGEAVKENHLSYHCIGLSGISFTEREIDDFSEKIKRLKNETQTPICCSIGFLTEKQALKLKNAGVNRINHNLNTSRNFYSNICTTHTYEQRINNIEMLKELGFEICCGGIIGLGEEKADIVDMLFDIKQIKPKAVPINFLIPVKGTALYKKDILYLTPEYCLKVLCLARILNQNADIRCAAGREVYLKGKEKLMFCVVDSIFSEGYLTEGGQNIEETIKLVENAGFKYCIE